MCSSETDTRAFCRTEGNLWTTQHLLLVFCFVFKHKASFNVHLKVRGCHLPCPSRIRDGHRGKLACDVLAHEVR